MDKKKFDWYVSQHTGRWTCLIPKDRDPIVRPGEFGVDWANKNETSVLMEIYTPGGSAEFIPEITIMALTFSRKDCGSLTEAKSWCEENVVNLAKAVVRAGQELCNLLIGEGDSNDEI